MWKAAIFSALQVGGAAPRVPRQWMTAGGMMICETGTRQWNAGGVQVSERV